jgi:hypothetical protein
MSETGRRSSQQKYASRTFANTTARGANRDKKLSPQRCPVNLNDQHDFVSLKEHILAMLAAEREKAEQHKVFVDLRFELAERALELDHIETLRRLDLLNHAHEEARQKEASFVGREVYESQTKEHNKWRDEVNSSLSTRQGRSSVTSGVAGAVGGLALSALFGMIMYLARAVLSGVPR